MTQFKVNPRLCRGSPRFDPRLRGGQALCDGRPINISLPLNSTQTVVLRGHVAALESWITQTQRHYAPRRLVLAIPHDAQNLPDTLVQRVLRGAATAYVCAGHTCSAPITELAELETALA